MVGGGEAIQQQSSEKCVTDCNNLPINVIPPPSQPAPSQPAVSSVNQIGKSSVTVSDVDMMCVRG